MYTVLNQSTIALLAAILVFNKSGLLPDYSQMAQYCVAKYSANIYLMESPPTPFERLRHQDVVSGCNLLLAMIFVVPVQVIMSQ